MKLEDGTEVAFPRGNIRKAKLVLTDELIAATAAPIESDDAPDDADLAEDGADRPTKRKGH
jgi:ribosome maturation factor RimP